VPLRILLADDSMTAQKMGKEILTGAGYEVTTVSNGAAAAKKLADKPDLYILDILMPGYSGIELAEKLRAAADTAKVPVLLTVGKMEHYNQAEVQRVKADGVIIKPFEATDLLGAVKKLLEAAAPPAPAQPSYEKTMIFTPPQIEEFKDQSYHDWKAETSEEPPPPPAPTPLPRITQEMAAAPAFLMDADATVEIPPAPPANSFDDTVTYTAPVIAAATAPAAAAAAPAMDFGMDFPAVAPVEAVPASAQAMDAAPDAVPTMGFGMDFPAVAPVESAPAVPVMDFGMAPVMETAPATAVAPAEQHEVEFNSAPKAGSVKVVTEHALEAEGEKEDIHIPQDPSLVTDPTQIATEFVTKFGVEGGVEEVGPVEKGFAESRPTQPSELQAAAPAEDDFEARVAAAMSGFGDEEPAAVEEVAAVVPIEEPAPIIAAPIVETPIAERTQKIDIPAEVMAAEAAAADPAPVIAEPEPMVDESKLPPAGMADAALVEQMQAAFADLPVATTPVEPEPAPVAEAAPAPAVATPVVADVAPMSPSGQDMELASALAAAVGGEPPTPAAPASEEHHTAHAITVVLGRMLPSIMEEVRKELEARKKGQS
jgi:CheY-like chemotaxis protein